MLYKLQRTAYSLILLAFMGACTPNQPLPTVMITPTSDPALASQVTPEVVAMLPSQTATLVPPTVTNTDIPTETPTLEPSSTPQPAVIAQAATVVNTPGAIMVSTLAATATPNVVPTIAPTTEPDAIVPSGDGLNLRSGPGTQFEPPLVLLAPNTPLRLLAYSPDYLWYKVETSDGQQGWAYSKLLTVLHEPPNLPVENATAQPQMIVVQSQGIPPLSGASPFGNVVTERVKQVFALGQEMGNNPRVFIKVGDSVTDQQAFMVGFGTGEYNLGTYTTLQASLDYFSRDAFARDSLASEPAFNSGSVMDSFRVPEEGLAVCQPQEKPLECEIRVMKPAYAVILFGGNEVRSMDIDSFTNQMQQLIDLTTSRGVIPIFNTFPHASNFHENAAAFNDALRAMALDNQIPLIDLEVAVRPLPNEGIELEDGFHLSMLGIRTAPINTINLNGDEKVYGAVLRDLLTLQMLDSLRIGLGLR